jgi:hypothetical protein
MQFQLQLVSENGNARFAVTEPNPFRFAKATRRAGDRYWALISSEPPSAIPLDIAVSSPVHNNPGGSQHVGKDLGS